MSETTLAASNAANNYTLKNNEDGSFAIKKAAVDVLTIDAAGKVAFPLGRSAWNSGEVIQETLSAIGGTSTTSVTFVNISSSALSITPKSVNSRLLIECTFDASGAPLVATNVAALFQLNESAGIGQIGASYQINANSGGGGNGCRVPASIRCILNNTALTPRAFNLLGATTNAGAAAAAFNLIMSIREVQN